MGAHAHRAETDELCGCAFHSRVFCFPRARSRRAQSALSFSEGLVVHFCSIVGVVRFPLFTIGRALFEIVDM